MIIKVFREHGWLASDPNRGEDYGSPLTVEDDWALRYFAAKLEFDRLTSELGTMAEAAEKRRVEEYEEAEERKQYELLKKKFG